MPRAAASLRFIVGSCPVSALQGARAHVLSQYIIERSRKVVTESYICLTLHPSRYVFTELPTWQSHPQVNTYRWTFPLGPLALPAGPSRCRPPPAILPSCHPKLSGTSLTQLFPLPKRRPHQAAFPCSHTDELSARHHLASEKFGVIFTCTPSCAFLGASSGHCP